MVEFGPIEGSMLAPGAAARPLLVTTCAAARPSRTITRTGCASDVVVGQFGAELRLRAWSDAGP
jgi:hypothetical protein